MWWWNIAVFLALSRSLVMLILWLRCQGLVPGWYAVVVTLVSGSTPALIDGVGQNMR